MGESRALTDSVLAQVLEQIRDHKNVLSEFAARSEPFVGELIETWMDAGRRALENVPAASAMLGDHDIAMRAWLDSLRRGALENFLAQMVEWARRCAQNEVSYDQMTHLLREYQRRALPFLIRAYPVDAELEMTLKAFDNLFAANTALAGAVYIEAIQQQGGDSARSEILGRILGGASYALGDVLTVVLGRLAVLIERARVAEDRAELLDIQQVAAGGAQMLRHVQEFARAERARNLVSVDVNGVMRDAAEVTRFLWRDQAEANGIVIDVVRDFADVPPVLAQPSALREAYAVMIVNAIDALPQGGVITLRTERRGDSVLASAICHAHEGEPRVRPALSIPGDLPQPAIGLRAAEKIAAQFNGTLTTETSPEGGAMFTLSLPLARQRDARKEQSAMSAQPANVLMIDNEPSVRDAFTRLLALYGHKVTTAENGEAGIAAFKAGKFDVVFTDLGMPGMSGWDVARALKKLDSKARVVLVTGWPIDLNPQKSKETGVDRIVTKPLDMSEVLALIEDAVALRGRT